MLHELLYYKLTNIGIEGDLYHAIKQIYQSPKSSVQLCNKLSQWFPVTAGVRQGDSLSPTLFAIYINDLSELIKNAEAGVYVGGQQLHMLMYADDIVLVAPDVHKSQQQLDILSSWCKINAKK